MTTALAFVFSGLTALGAIGGGIWLEARMPVSQPSSSASRPSSPAAASLSEYPTREQGAR